MAYINVKDIGRVYVMAEGDRVLRSGVVAQPDGTIIPGKCADPERVAQWTKDRKIIGKKAKAKKKARR